MTWVQATHASRVAARVTMSVIKVMLAAATTMALTLPAFAGDCYKDHKRGDAADQTAGSILITLDNRTKRAFEVYIKDTRNIKRRYWLEPGEKTAPKFNLRRKKMFRHRQLLPEGGP